MVDFYADWCGPCKMMAPILQETAGKFGDQVKIVKIDVDRNPAVAGHYSVSAVPTLILFKNGKIMWRKSGVASVGELAKVIEGV